jgi:hypothetical protein
MTGLEGRRTERFELELPAELAAAGLSESEAKIAAKTVDVSAGGAFFLTKKSVSVGTPVEIELLLPLDKLKKIKGKRAQIKVSGIVVRSVKKGLAVCFDENYEILPLPA